MLRPRADYRQAPNANSIGIQKVDTARIYTDQKNISLIRAIRVIRG
jgi:hypothetical protein